MTLEVLTDGAYWWNGSPDGRIGTSNCGVVLDDDGATVIDTGMVRSQWEPFADAVRALDVPVRRVIVTSADIWHVGGTRAFTHAGVYATRPASELLDLPLNTAAYEAFMPEFTDGFEDLAVLGTRPATHLIDEPAVLTGRIEVIPAPGHTRGDCVVLVPDADVCFTGSLATVGTTPLCFAGDPRVWLETLDPVATFASRFVPGRGPLGTPDDLAALQEYLGAVIAADGDPAALGAGDWDTWSERRFDAVNIECAALRRRGDASLPPTMVGWISPA